MGTPTSIKQKPISAELLAQNTMTGTTAEEALAKVGSEFSGFEQLADEFLFQDPETGTYYIDHSAYQHRVRYSLFSARESIACAINPTAECFTTEEIEANTAEVTEFREKYDRHIKDLHRITGELQTTNEENPIIKLLIAVSTGVVGGLGLGFGYQIWSHGPLGDKLAKMAETRGWMQEAYGRLKLYNRINKDWTPEERRQLQACGFRDGLNDARLTPEVRSKILHSLGAAMAALTGMMVLAGGIGYLASSGNDDSETLPQSTIDLNGASSSSTEIPDEVEIDDLDLDIELDPTDVATLSSQRAAILSEAQHLELQLAQSIAEVELTKSKEVLAGEISRTTDRIMMRIYAGDYDAAQELYESEFMPLESQYFQDESTLTEYQNLDAQFQSIFTTGKTVRWFKANSTLISMIAGTSLLLGTAVAPNILSGETFMDGANSFQQGNLDRIDDSGRTPDDFYRDVERRVDEVEQQLKARLAMGANSCSAEEFNLTEAFGYNSEIPETTLQLVESDQTSPQEAPAETPAAAQTFSSVEDLYSYPYPAPLYFEAVPRVTIPTVSSEPVSIPMEAAMPVEVQISHGGYMLATGTDSAVGFTSEPTSSNYEIYGRSDTLSQSRAMIGDSSGVSQTSTGRTYDFMMEKLNRTGPTPRATQLSSTSADVYRFPTSSPDMFDVIEGMDSSGNINETPARTPTRQPLGEVREITPEARSQTQARLHGARTMFETTNPGELVELFPTQESSATRGPTVRGSVTPGHFFRGAAIGTGLYAAGGIGLELGMEELGFSHAAKQGVHGTYAAGGATLMARSFGSGPAGISLAGGVAGHNFGSSATSAMSYELGISEEFAQPLETGAGIAGGLAVGTGALYSAAVVGGPVGWGIAIGATAACAIGGYLISQYERGRRLEDAESAFRQSIESRMSENPDSNLNVHLAAFDKLKDKFQELKDQWVHFGTQEFADVAQLFNLDQDPTLRDLLPEELRSQLNDAQITEALKQILEETCIMMGWWLHESYLTTVLNSSIRYDNITDSDMKLVFHEVMYPGLGEKMGQIKAHLSEDMTQRDLTMIREIVHDPNNYFMFKTCGRYVRDELFNPFLYEIDVYEDSLLNTGIKSLYTAETREQYARVREEFGTDLAMLALEVENPYEPTDMRLRRETEYRAQSRQDRYERLLEESDPQQIIALDTELTRQVESGTLDRDVAISRFTDAVLASDLVPKIKTPTDAQLDHYQSQAEQTFDLVLRDHLTFTGSYADSFFEDFLPQLDQTIDAMAEADAIPYSGDLTASDAKAWVRFYAYELVYTALAEYTTNLRGWVSSTWYGDWSNPREDVDYLLTIETTDHFIQEFEDDETRYEYKLDDLRESLETQFEKLR